MGNVLGYIYEWFLSFYGQNLSYFLWGFNPATGAYTNSNLYNFVGLITIVISLFIVLLFYYILSHPRFCRWWSWLITLIVNSVIALFVGYGIVSYKYNNGYVPDALMYERDAEGNIVSTLISITDCWGFGFANMFVAAMCFVLFTFLLKWWSKDAKHVPFL